MRDPSGGTAGRVKPYGRLGWMGACAEYSLDGEGFYRSHLYWSRRVAERSNDLQFFYCAAGRLASRTAALSEAMAAPGWFKSLVVGTSWWSETFSAGWLWGTAATGTGGAVTTAETAANASASPAPNRSSRPGEPRSRAVFTRIART